MSLYFSAAVWSSLALCSIGLIADRLHRYRRRTVQLLPSRHPRLIEQRR
jgi:hypothetical protein